MVNYNNDHISISRHDILTKNGTSGTPITPRCKSFRKRRVYLQPEQINITISSITDSKFDIEEHKKSEQSNAQKLANFLSMCFCLCRHRSSY